MRKLRIFLAACLAGLGCGQHAFSQQESLAHMIDRGWKHAKDEYSIVFNPDHTFLLGTVRGDTLRGAWQYDDASRRFLVNGDGNVSLKFDLAYYTAKEFGMNCFELDRFALFVFEPIIPAKSAPPAEAAPSASKPPAKPPAPGTCHACKGTGRYYRFDLDCKYCDGGRIVCNACGGYGKARNPRYTGESCLTCSGSGRERCILVGGCNGTGRVSGVGTCSTCGGRGKFN